MLTNYILTVMRRMRSQWFLSIIKLVSLISGIVCFLLVWFYVVDQQNKGNNTISENPVIYMIILGSIVLIMSLVYTIIIRSQFSLRYKELFVRKYYGESIKGLILMHLLESLLFIIIALFLSLILIDQVVPFFNLITDRAIDLKTFRPNFQSMAIPFYLLFLCVFCGILPFIKLARAKTGDILDKIGK